MEIFFMVLLTTCFIIVSYLASFISSTVFIFDSFKIYLNQKIKKESKLNLIYFKRSKLKCPRIKIIAITFVIELILYFIGNMAYIVLYLSKVIDTESTKIYGLVLMLLLGGIYSACFVYVKIKDRIYAKREKLMSDDEFEELKLQLKDELPWLYFKKV